MLLGCTHTQTVVPLDDQWDEVNRRAADRTAVATLEDGRQISAKNLQLTPDSTSWLDPETGAVRNVATASITDIRFPCSGRL